MASPVASHKLNLKHTIIRHRYTKQHMKATPEPLFMSRSVILLLMLLTGDKFRYRRSSFCRRLQKQPGTLISIIPLNFCSSLLLPGLSGHLGFDSIQPNSQYTVVALIYLSVFMLTDNRTREKEPSILDSNVKCHSVPVCGQLYCVLM